MERFSRIRKIIRFNKSGTGGYTPRITLPTHWLSDMGISKDSNNNDVILEYDAIRKTITIAGADMIVESDATISTKYVLPAEIITDCTTEGKSYLGVTIGGGELQSKLLFVASYRGHRYVVAENRIIDERLSSFQKPWLVGYIEILSPVMKLDDYVKKLSEDITYSGKVDYADVISFKSAIGIDANTIYYMYEHPEKATVSMMITRLISLVDEIIELERESRIER